MSSKYLTICKSWYNIQPKYKFKIITLVSENTKSFNNILYRNSNSYELNLKVFFIGADTLDYFSFYCERWSSHWQVFYKSFIKKRLQHRYSLWIFLNLYKTSFLQNTLDDCFWKAKVAITFSEIINK